MYRPRTDHALTDYIRPVVRYAVSEIRRCGAVSWSDVETVCGDGRRLSVFEDRCVLLGITKRSICQTNTGVQIVGYTIGDRDLFDYVCGLLRRLSVFTFFRFVKQ